MSWQYSLAAFIFPMELLRQAYSLIWPRASHQMLLTGPHLFVLIVHKFTVAGTRDVLNIYQVMKHSSLIA